MADDIQCPICGSSTKLRTVKKGADVGKQFFVCNKYPECKGRVLFAQISLEYKGTSLKEMSKADVSILRQFLADGKPCIPFIPVDALEQSISIIKPEGTKGYFIAKVPTLYADGSIKYLYKEEFMLYTATRNLMADGKKNGCVYSFLGLELPMTDIWEGKYLSPDMFYQNNRTLFRMDFQEDIKFFRQDHAPSFEVAFMPGEHNLKVKNVCVVNFLKVPQILLDDKDNPSRIISSYEGWTALRMPASEQDLKKMFSHHLASISEKLNKRK